MRKKITEYIDLDLNKNHWVCNKCDHDIISADQNYKKGLLIYERDPREIHQPHIEGEHTFAADPNWVRLLEFYCPGCGTMVETEMLAVGHPITHDIEIDLSNIKLDQAKQVEEVK
jgi:acetophenone carboxylase